MPALHRSQGRAAYPTSALRISLVEAIALAYLGRLMSSAACISACVKLAVASLTTVTS
jgi:hypothetical protein